VSGAKESLAKRLALPLFAIDPLNDKCIFLDAAAPPPFKVGIRPWRNANVRVHRPEPDFLHTTGRVKMHATRKPALASSGSMLSPA